MVMFYWKLQLNIMFVIYPLYIPPSFIRQPSGQWTGHKGVWLDGLKRMGEGWVSVFGERSGVTALWQHMSRPGSYRPCISWMRVCSLLSAIYPHLHIRQRAKWPNAGFDAKQTQWFTGIIPSSDPASAFLKRLQCVCFVRSDWLCFTFNIHSLSIKSGIILNLSSKLHSRKITHATSAIIFSAVICTNQQVQ